VPESLAISEVALTPASPIDAWTGLLGFVRFRLGAGLEIDGITLRRTAAGRLAISFPSRRDRAGRDHPLLRPLDGVTRDNLERQVLGALRAQGVLP
jgi:hypothetical protein